MENGVAAVLAVAASALGSIALLCEVKAHLFLLDPSVDPTITMVTAVNCSSCFDVWRESTVFMFGSAFEHYLSNPTPGASIGERP